MDQPGHLLASRRHAEKAISIGGGNDPAAQGRLAQTEALLAVAAATGRLADALSHPGAPAPPAAQAPGYQVAGIRKQYPNACTPWTAEADAALLAACQAGHDMPTLADTFGRQPSAIRSRLNRLGGPWTTARPHRHRGGLRSSAMIVRQEGAR